MFGSLPVSEFQSIIECDTTSFPGYSVYGYAAPGTLASDKTWLIYRVKNDSTINKRFANGSNNNDQTWTNVASITVWK